MSFSIIPILLLIVPIFEIAVFILIGSEIGVLSTLAMILVTAIIGTILLRQQGLGILQRLQSESRSGHIPGRELVHGAMIMVAGILLLTPGFVTDSIGFLLFVPAFRDLAWNFLKTRINIVNFSERGPQSGGFSRGYNTQNNKGNDGDAPFVDLNDDEYETTPNPASPWHDKPSHNGDKEASQKAVSAPDQKNKP